MDRAWRVVKGVIRGDSGPEWVGNAIFPPSDESSLGLGAGERAVRGGTLYVEDVDDCLDR